MAGGGAASNILACRLYREEGQKSVILMATEIIVFVGIFATRKAYKARQPRKCS